MGETSLTNDTSGDTSAAASLRYCGMCDRHTAHAAPLRQTCGCLQCKECGVIAFTGPTPSGLAFDRWTAEKCWEVTDSRNQLMQRIAAEIKARARGRALLDVGCSVGSFLRLFERPAWKVAGVDPSPAAMVQARQVADNAYVGTLEDGSVPPGQYDVVSILDAVYYSQSPRRMLTIAASLLKQDALLVVEFPNYEYSLLRRGPWWPMRSCANLRYDSLHRYMLPTAAVLECAASLGLVLEDAVLLGPPSRKSFTFNFLGRLAGGCAVTLATKSQGLVDIAPRLALFLRRAASPRSVGAPPDFMARVDVRSGVHSDLTHIASIRRRAFPDGIAASLPGTVERMSLGSELGVAHSKGAVAGFVEVWPNGLPLAGVRHLARGHLVSAASRFLTSGGAFDEFVKSRLVRRVGGLGVELRAVAVDPAFRSCGVGSALIAYGLAKARELRPGLASFAWVSSSNHSSIAAFRKNKFKVSGIRFSGHAPELLLVAAPRDEQ